MAKHKVLICCWNAGHVNELDMTSKQENDLSSKIRKLKAVCPTCRNDGLGNQAIFIQSGETLFNPSKVYKCRHGHITTISPFTNGNLHVKFGHGDEDFFNVEGSIEELQELIDKKQISCHHSRENGQNCGCKIKAVDDYSLEYPVTAGIKTTTRLGDLWDKAGVEPVRPGSYDKDGNYKNSKTDEANRERLRRMRKRNMPKDKHPGTPITKATKRDYGRRSKSDVKPERLR
jgi:hypothetical protein